MHTCLYPVTTNTLESLPNQNSSSYTCFFPATATNELKILTVLLVTAIVHQCEATQQIRVPVLKFITLILLTNFFREHRVQTQPARPIMMDEWWMVRNVSTIVVLNKSILTSFSCHAFVSLCIDAIYLRAHTEYNNHSVDGREKQHEAMLLTSIVELNVSSATHSLARYNNNCIQLHCCEVTENEHFTRT